VADLFDVYPELRELMDTVCAGRSWCVTGASAMVSDGGSFWFELAKPRHWRQEADGTPVVGMGAIGGSLECGESVLDCLDREMMEEIGVSGRVESAGLTYLVYEESRIETLSLPQRELPVPMLLTVSANLFRQEMLPECEILAIVTFAVHIDRLPRMNDLYGLLRVPTDALPALLRDDVVPLRDLLQMDGVDLTVREALPDPCLLSPVWTVRSLQLLLCAGYLT
jgi:8-oxo-dGTP pyrophosphatase MutT (NUDIX family)